MYSSQNGSGISPGTLGISAPQFQGQPRFLPANQELQSPTAGTVQVEDNRTGTSLETLKRAFTYNLLYTQGKYESIAAIHDYYMALAYTVRNRLIKRRINTVKTYIERDVKSVYYLSLEFLLGRQLGKNLLNLGLYDSTSQALQELGIKLEELMEQEAEPGLGNGGLGRLAACFLDSLATLEIPARGYGIRYDFGIFHQTIHRGWQVERPDLWQRKKFPSDGLQKTGPKSWQLKPSR